MYNTDMCHVECKHSTSPTLHPVLINFLTYRRVTHRTSVNHTTIQIQVRQYTSLIRCERITTHTYIGTVLYYTGRLTVKDFVFKKEGL